MPKIMTKFFYLRVVLLRQYHSYTPQPPPNATELYDGAGNPPKKNMARAASRRIILKFQPPNILRRADDSTGFMHVHSVA